MGRPSKKSVAAEPQAAAMGDAELLEITSPAESIAEIPLKVRELMRLYPHYEEMWITPQGFVHPKNAPKYLVKGATLYKNEFFQS